MQIQVREQGCSRTGLREAAWHSWGWGGLVQNEICPTRSHSHDSLPPHQQPLVVWLELLNLTHQQPADNCFSSEPFVMPRVAGPL